MSRTILMPVRTVAEWGGVHEWTVDAASALIAQGHKVIFVGAGDVFAERAVATGADFIHVNWDSWKDGVDKVMSDPLSRNADLIFAHAPQARMLGLELARLLGIELQVMIHGAYHDYMYTWSHLVDGFLAASPSLVHFTQRFGRVEPWKVNLVPNAAPESVFDMPILTFEEKTRDGDAHVVTASRLSRDKLPQLTSTVEALTTAANLRPDLNWVLDVFGDGPLRGTYEARYKQAFHSLPNVETVFHGWIEPQQVPVELNRAVLGIMAGMGGVRSIAAGALTIGVGARNLVGVQYGRNLRAGIWSNFGDHGVFRFEPTPVVEDLRYLLSGSQYDETVSLSREILHRTNSQTIVDGMMLSALQC